MALIVWKNLTGWLYASWPIDERTSAALSSFSGLWCKRKSIFPRRIAKCLSVWRYINGLLSIYSSYKNVAAVRGQKMKLAGAVVCKMTSFWPLKALSSWILLLHSCMALTFLELRNMPCLEMTCPRNVISSLYRLPFLGLNFNLYWCIWPNTAYKCKLVLKCGICRSNSICCLARYWFVYANHWVIFTDAM